MGTLQTVLPFRLGGDGRVVDRAGGYGAGLPKLWGDGTTSLIDHELPVVPAVRRDMSLLLHVLSAGSHARWRWTDAGGFARSEKR